MTSRNTRAAANCFYCWETSRMCDQIIVDRSLSTARLLNSPVSQRCRAVVKTKSCRELTPITQPQSSQSLRVMAPVVPCNLQDYMTQKKSGRHQAVPLVYARVSGPPLADPAVKIRLGQISQGSIISVTVARGELYAAVRPHCNFSSKATSRAAKDVSHFPGRPLGYLNLRDQGYRRRIWCYGLRKKCR